MTIANSLQTITPVPTDSTAGLLCSIIPYLSDRRNSHTRNDGGGRLLAGKFGVWNEGSDVNYELSGLG